VKLAKENFKVQIVITSLSLVLLIVKTVAYFLTHSLSVLTDALESIVNVVAGFIGLYSLYVAAKPKDVDHPYGHGKAEFISAAAEGTLIVAAGILIVYETLANFFNNAPLHALDTGIWLVGATALINFVAGTICITIGKKNKSLALQASGKHLQIDTYSTLAIVAGIGAMLIWKVYWIDRVIALGMSALIIYNGYKIIRSSFAGIMDEADLDLLNTFIEVLNQNKPENWIDLHNLRVIKYGSLLHIDCHLTVPWFLNVHEAHREIDSLSDLIKTHFGDAIELFVHTDGCLAISCAICNKSCNERQASFEKKLTWTLDNILSNKKHQLEP
jgi:cation diffusion facilitator family transporter